MRVDCGSLVSRMAQGKEKTRGELAHSLVANVSVMIGFCVHRGKMYARFLLKLKMGSNIVRVSSGSTLTKQGKAGPFPFSSITPHVII